MAAARTKQLEDKLARYERILSNCAHCKAALALVEEEDATSQATPPPSGGSSRQTAPEASSTASMHLDKPPGPTSRQDQRVRSSKQAASTSQPKLSSGSSNVAGSSSSTRGTTRRSKNSGPDPSTNTTRRQSSRLSKSTTVEASSSLPKALSIQKTTDHSLDLRPTSLKPSSSGVGTLSADSGLPNTTGPSFSKSSIDAPRSRTHPQNQADWVQSADKMLREVPLGWVWHEKLLRIDKSLLAAVATDTTIIPDDEIPAVDDMQNKDHLLTLVRGFAHRHSVQRVNFQHLLLVCLCRVLSTQNFPQSSIVDVLQICISDTSERNIGKYLSGAKWVNKIMDRLFFTDWRYRAIDLLTLCMYRGRGLRLLH